MFFGLSTVNIPLGILLLLYVPYYTLCISCNDSVIKRVEKCSIS